MFCWDQSSEHEDEDGTMSVTGSSQQSHSQMIHIYFSCVHIVQIELLNSFTRDTVESPT